MKIMNIYKLFRVDGRYVAAPDMPEAYRGIEEYYEEKASKIETIGDVLVYNNPTETKTEGFVHVNPEDLDLDLDENITIEDAERTLIERALQEAGGNRKVAAERLGVSERTIYRKIQEFGL